MKKKVNVLVTGMGSTTAISVVKGLKKQEDYDVTIIGTDINARYDIAGSQFCDKFYRVPPAIDESEFIKALIDIIQKESVDLLIPIVDIEIEIIAKNKKVLQKYSYILTSSYDTVKICNDKLKTYQSFLKFDIPTFRTLSVDNLDDLNRQLLQNNLAYPFIAKPRDGVSSRDVFEIKSEEQVFLIKQIDHPIIQEKGYGVEYTIDVFYDGNNVISVVPRERIETRSGISYKGRTVKDDLLIGYAEKIVRNIDLVGPSNIQCFKNDGEVKFFEINPRFSGSLPLTIASGINTPLFSIKMALGEELKPVTDFKLIKMCRYWDEVFYGC